MDWKVAKDDRMDPPIHTEYLRSGGARTLISMRRRSWMPGYMVEPPDNTMLLYRSLRISTSHFMIVLYVVKCTPSASLPMMFGSNNTSGQRNRWLPILILRPSGNSYIFISASKSRDTYVSFSLISRTISRSAVVVKE